MAYIKKSKYIYSLISFLLIVFALIFVFWAKTRKVQDEDIISYPIVYYNQVDTLVSADYIFQNEGLNQPSAVRSIPGTNEFVVLDKGNICLYIFTKYGEFVRMMGRQGQGPGDLWFPFYMNVDSEGNIYVYEWRNLRISIFSKEGKFIDLFRIPKELGYGFYSSSYGFSIADNGEIVLNMPHAGYYFSIYSKDGSLLREFGEVPIVTTTQRGRMNIHYAEGFPFKHKNGNYYIFLSQMGSVKIFNDKGIFIKEHLLDIPEVEANLKKITELIKKERINYIGIYFTEVIMHNDLFYLMVRMHAPKGKKVGNKYIEKLMVYVLDENLEIKKKIIMPDFWYYDNCPDVTVARQFSLWKRFCLLNDKEEIIIPNFYESQIIKYGAKK
ncbi:hypothetical protein AMJ80_06110 [bacterium SM23_31]|nr:MAG: hypothetical protein AMJ80_06110 [bacterium SM23_31]